MARNEGGVEERGSVNGRPYIELRTGGISVRVSITDASCHPNWRSAFWQANEEILDCLRRSGV